MRKLLIAFVVFLYVFSLTAKANATVLIRDAEVEFVLRELSKPIYKVAGLDPESLRIYILLSDELNAFVMGGQNIFVTTGLINHSSDPEMIVGVLAHEVGHISGGHLVATKEEMQNLRQRMLLGLIAGVAAGVATGSSDVAIGAGLGSSSSQISSIFKFSRTQESSADQAGIKYLTRLGVKPDGLMGFLNDLNKKSRTFNKEQNAYLHTHPLSQDRVDSIKSYAQQNPPKVDSYLTPFVKRKFSRVVAKIYAYTHGFDETLMKYGGEDLDSNYAKSIAYMKNSNTNKAIEYLDKIIDKEPLSPFLFEMKGEIYYEAGRFSEAIPYFQKAYTYAPRENILKMEYAKSLIAAKLEVTKAIGLLEEITYEDKFDIMTWQELSLAYGIKKDKANSYIAQGWVSLLKGDIPSAKRLAGLAETELVKDASQRVRRKLEDLKVAIEGVEYEEATLSDD
jgi:predicted Zn-dependent protease